MQSAMFSIMALSTASACIIVGVVSVILAIPAGMAIYYLINKKKADKNKTSASNIIQEALNEAKTVKKEAVLEARDEVFKLKSECDAELKERRAEMQRAENRVNQREEFIEKKELLLDSKTEAIEKVKKDLEVKFNKMTKLFN